MPLIAKRKGTDERIDITMLDLPHEILQANEYVCQICGATLIINAGRAQRQRYFAHVAACTNTYQSHTESSAHRAAKQFLAAYLQKLFKVSPGTSVEYEVPIPETMRLADLVATFPTGWRVAHEVQLESITTEQLQQRTNAYLLAGIDVVWWLGNDADTPAHRAWSREIFGHALVLTLPKTPGERFSIIALASSEHLADGEHQETLLPMSWVRGPFLQRWAYARQMRNDPRLIDLITLFASRVRTPSAPPALSLPPATGESTPRLTIVRQIMANPVVQEAVDLFGASITDVQLIYTAPSPTPLVAAVPQSTDIFSPERLASTLEEDQQHTGDLRVQPAGTGAASKVSKRDAAASGATARRSQAPGEQHLAPPIPGRAAAL